MKSNNFHNYVLMLTRHVHEHKNDLYQLLYFMMSFLKIPWGTTFVETFKNSADGWENLGIVHERKRCVG
jgi:hypothetical protein